MTENPTTVVAVKVRDFDESYSLVEIKAGSETPPTISPGIGTPILNIVPPSVSFPPATMRILSTPPAPVPKSNPLLDISNVKGKIVGRSKRGTMKWNTVSEGQK